MCVSVDNQWHRSRTNHVALECKQLLDGPVAAIGIVCLWVVLKRKVWYRDVNVVGMMAHAKRWQWPTKVPVLTCIVNTWPCAFMRGGNIAQRTCG